MADNLVYKDGRYLTCPVKAGTVSGDPVTIGANLCGVAITDRDAAGNATVDFQGVYDVTVVATTVAVGEAIYINATTDALSDDPADVFFGFALEAISGGSPDVIQVKLGESAGTTATVADGSVTRVKLAGGFTKVSLLAGAAAGDHAIAAMAVGDELVSVLHISTAASIATMADLTSEFTVAAGKLTNVGGTDTTSDQLLVIWTDLT